MLAFKGGHVTYLCDWCFSWGPPVSEGLPGSWALVPERGLAASSGAQSSDPAGKLRATEFVQPPQPAHACANCVSAHGGAERLLPAVRGEYRCPDCVTFDRAFCTHAPEVVAQLAAEQATRKPSVREGA